MSQPLRQVPQKIVLTGGPCAGKTTLSQMIERAFDRSVVSVPEAASLLFSGGFPRFAAKEATHSTQRAIFRVQEELENSFAAEFPRRTLVLDRATIDGAAYWPEGTQDFFRSLNTTLDLELARYQSVIYLESAAEADYARHRAKNPNRRESWEEAKRLDQQTLALWSQHPDFVLVRNQRSFDQKVLEVLAAVAARIDAGDEDEQE